MVAGTFIGFLLNLYICLYFIGIVCFQARILGDIVRFFGVYISCSCHLSCGRRRLFNCKSIRLYFSTLIIFMMLLMFSFRLFQFDFIRPVFEGGYQSFFSLFPKTLLYFSGFEIIFYLVPFMRDPKQAKKAVALGIGTSTVFYSITLFIVIGCMTVAAAKIMTWPTISLIHALEVPGIFIERFDLFLQLTWTAQQFTCMLGSFKGSPYRVNGNLSSKK
nr:GerAB/ArcD/ProY family transporter [Bacillus subtilis]